MKNKIELIKKIRKITNISIQLCKKILEKNKFNIEKSLISLKKIKIKKKNKTKEGIILNKIKNNIAIMLKINCETDFTSKNKEFQLFANKIINFCFNNNNNINLKIINNKFKYKKNYLISKFNENINIKNICYIKNKYLYKYLHNKKIGTILKYNIINKKNNLNKIKKISMHITAMNPKYISYKNIKKNIIKKEKNKLSIYIKNKNKLKKKLINKLKIKCLEEQKFIFNDKLLVKNYLKKNNIKIIKFYRFEIKK